MKEERIPKHVAIIMDGNGRWATKRGKQRSAGHLAGSKNLEKIAVYAVQRGIKVLSVYAFSTDNFKRSASEVDYLMNLFIKMFQTEMKLLKKNGIKVVFSGRKEPLREDVLKSMENIVTKAKENTNGILNICLNYGGQEEIIDATKKIVEDIQKKKFHIEDLNKENFYHYLYQDLPPIDLLIRTSGEYRVSNFMPYQSTYSEFYFTDTLFPDFNEKELDKALFEFNNRDRRFGGNSQK